MPNNKPILTNFQWLLLVAIVVISIKQYLPDAIVVDANPVDIEGKFVLIVYETEDVDNLDYNQSLIFTSTKLRKYLDDNKFEYRFLDKDVPPKSEPWLEAFNLDRESLPWIYATDGESGFSKPLQADSDTVRADLEGLK